MADVSVTIGGRSFRMACGDGEEQHLVGLAADLDHRITRLREHFGEVGDTRLLIMAALTLSDELSEQKRKNSSAEEEMQILRTAHRDILTRTTGAEDAIAKRIDALATSVEQLVRFVEDDQSSAQPSA
ncbi:MAG: cell division protein ZapA [Pseudomonadota bacterium]